MKRFHLLIAFLLSFALLPSSLSVAAQKIVTSAQVNGTWRKHDNGKWVKKNGEFKVLALGKQKLQIEFSGAYEYRVHGEWAAHVGVGYGIATIKGASAMFRPEGAEESCRIKMQFRGSKLIVEQKGVCGFGQNVTAAGRYHNVKGDEPSFSEIATPFPEQASFLSEVKQVSK